MNATRLLFGLALAAGAALFVGIAVRPDWLTGAGPPAAGDGAPRSQARPREAPRREVVPVGPNAAHDADEGEHWVEANNRATRLLEAGELERAVELLESCHAARPGEDVFRRNLAEALVRLARSAREESSDLPRAVALLARAIELAPERDDVAALRAILERWRREAEVEENHWTDRSLYFELSYDAERSDILERFQDVLDHLEASYAGLRDWFGVDPVIEGGRPKIRVKLYNRDEFDRLTGLGDWAGGVFDGVIRVSVEDLEAERHRWERVLEHELVHAFVHEVGGSDVPGWLNEGLAQRLDGEPRLAEARERVAAMDELYPLERLRGSLASWSDAEAIGRAYAQSLVLVEHLATFYGDRTLRAMVAGCAEGVTPEQSFERATGVPLAFALEDLQSHYLDR